jgi:hypothetical protein
LSIRKVTIPTTVKYAKTSDMKVGQAGYIRGKFYEGELIYRASAEAYVGLTGMVSWSFVKPNFEVEILPEGTVIELVV